MGNVPGFVALSFTLLGCGYPRPEDVPGPVDGEIIPDASICADLSKSCITSTVLRDCQTVGQYSVDTTCSWGCLNGSPVHCGKLQPNGGVLIETDLIPDPRLVDSMVASGGTINTGDGSITNLRAAGAGVQNGIDFEIRNLLVAGGIRSVGVFRFGKLTLLGNWVVTGPNALAIASLDDIVIQGRLDLRGDCQGSNSGPGGFPGGGENTTASGPGGGKGGSASNLDHSGGGGGGYGANGGNGGRFVGGNAPGAGVSWGDETISLLVGGGGGGGGSGDAGSGGGFGGGGGGAVQIAANGNVSIRVSAAPSGINAGGCGGKGGLDGGGGGGGAGGTILIEAPAVELDGTYLVVNGGGGGGGNGAPLYGNSGGWGSGRATPCPGPGPTDGDGGGGGASGATSRQGQNGQDAGSSGGYDSAGGGGGAVGRIRVNTRFMGGVTVKNGAVVSPTFEETGSTSMKGVANVR